MRILYLTANPQWVKRKEPIAPEGDKPKDKLQALFKKYAKLDLWAELRDVTDVLFNARAEGAVQLEVVPEVRRQDVVRYINSRKPNIVHFSGHGEKNEIILNDEHGEDGESVSNEWLQGALAEKHIDVLVLNCCWSADMAQALKNEVGLIIGTDRDLGSDNAAYFARKFYDALQNGETLRVAFEAATKKFAGNLYFKECRDESILDQVLPPESKPEGGAEAEQEKLSPAQQVIAYQAQLRQIRSRLGLNVIWDVTKIYVAFQIAFIGYGILNGAYQPYFEAIRCWMPAESPLPSLFQGLSEIHVFIQEQAPWLTWEPFAIMTALVGSPGARFVSYLWILLGSRAARYALDVISTRPEPLIEQELATGRIETMFNRLAEHEQ